MTKVPSRLEAKPAHQARVVAARKATAGFISSPRLARGRDEKLVRSRSPTPPTAGQYRISTDELLSPKEAAGYGHYNRSGSPTSTVTTHTASYAQESTPTPSASNPSLTSPGPSHHAWRHRSMSESQFSESTRMSGMEDTNARVQQSLKRSNSGVDEYASETAHSSNRGFGHSDRSYPARTSGLHYDPTRPFENKFVPPASPQFATSVQAERIDAFYERRPLPLAPWPAGKPRDTDIGDRDDSTGGMKKKGIKKPYKTQEEKAKVKAVRDSGACMRCVIFRQAVGHLITGRNNSNWMQCEVLSKGQSCKACGVISRKWHIPCTKLWLRDRWVFLFPDEFFDHLQLRNTAAFPPYPPANRSHVFDLILAKDYGLRLVIKVFAVVGVRLEEDMFRKFIFQPGVAQPTFRPTLPLMAEQTSAAVENIEYHVGNHMNQLSEKPETYGLPLILFPEEMGQPFIRDIFKAVCGFQESVMQGQSTPIAFALKTIYVRFLIGRTFYIPYDSIRALNEELPNEYKLPEETLVQLENGDYSVCPKYADRFIKAALFKSLKTALLPKCFTDLEELFHLMEKDHGKSKLSELSRDEAFCTIVVVLLLAGHCQIKIMQSVAAQLETNWNGVRGIPNGPARLYHDAERYIYEIEREVINHTLYLWSYQFCKESMVGAVEPHQDRAARVATSYNLIGTFRDLRMLHADSINRIRLDLDLEGMNRDQAVRDYFVKTNLERIMLRLEAAIWQPKAKRR